MAKMCVGKPNIHQTSAFILNSTGMVGVDFPILVVQEVDCVITRSFAAIVYTKGQYNAGELVYLTQEPKIIDLQSLLVP